MSRQTIPWHGERDRAHGSTDVTASDVIASIEAAAAASIKSIKAAGEFARGRQPQLFDDTAGLVAVDPATDDAVMPYSDMSWADSANAAHATEQVFSSGDENGILASTGTSSQQGLVVPSGGTLELSSPYSGTVSFGGASGVLKVDNSADFTGKIEGQLTTADVIDFTDITAGSNATISYSGNNSPGTLTVSDGVHTASVALTGDYSLANFTASSDGQGGTSVIDPPVAGDGSAGAPAGTPQFAGILNGYAVRPPWEVAGVDYAVGITPGTVLKDPATIKMAGVTVDVANHQILVTGANVTLNGYDFSLDGGWAVDTQAANTTISNCNFGIGSNHNFTIYGDTGSSNLTVVDCVIDGNMQSDNLNNGLIYTSSPGLTVEYTLLENGYSDFIQAQGGGTVTIKYNVLNNNGNANAHPDWLQTLGNASSPFNETIEYNTVYQTVVPNSDGTQGFMLNDNGAVLASAVLAYNTIVALPGSQVSPVTSVNGGASLTGTALIYDNYADTRGGTFGNESFFADPTYSANAEYYNNINMETGGLYYQNATPSLTAPAGVNSSKTVNTNPSLTPTVSITSETVNGANVTLQGQASSNVWLGGTTVEIFDNGNEIGVVNANSSGAWSFTTSALSTGTHDLTATANNFFGYASAPASKTAVINSGSAPPPSAPTAPTIASFSQDSGTVGDHITSDNTPTLTGSAGANSTIAVFDGATQIGSATANSSGAWTFTTAALSNGTHNFSATATGAGGTSPASSTFAITVDTVAPSAPVETGDSIVNGNQVQITGTAEANSTVQVYDGTALVGTATVGSTGAWSATTSALSNGTHSLTAKATDAAGNVSTASAPLDPVIGAPSAPSITSFSQDSGTVGDHITSDSTPTLTGSAAANSTIKVFDGTTQIGSATANSSGAWTFTTAALSNGTHNFSATATGAGGTSPASSTFAITVDTVAPSAPVETGDSIVNGNQVQITGTAEANSTVQVYDGTTLVGTATVGSSGAWSATTSALSNGTHSLTATATDAAGNVSTASAPLDPVIGASFSADFNCAVGSEHYLVLT